MSPETRELVYCPTCASAVDADGRCGECIERERAHAQREAWWLARANVPARHARFRSWADLRGSAEYLERVRALRAFVERGDSVLALLGPRGTGKTQAACVAARETITASRGRRGARYVRAGDLLADLKRRYSAERQSAETTEAAWLDWWSAPHLLAIDEIGELARTEHAEVKLTSIIDARYAALKPTLLAGNITAGDYAATVGSSIADRTNEGGGVLWFGGWPSWRGATGA